jgi:hypothetical protein
MSAKTQYSVWDRRLHFRTAKSPITPSGKPNFIAKRILKVDGTDLEITLEHENNPVLKGSYAGTSGDTYAIKFGYSLSLFSTGSLTCEVTRFAPCVGVGCTPPDTACSAFVYSKLDWIIVAPSALSWA